MLDCIKAQAVIKFTPQNIVVTLENILSNSQKTHVTSLRACSVSFQSEKKEV